MAFANAQDIQAFLFAGKATLTLKSEVTGTHFTYRVKQAADRDGNPSDRYFVNVLTGNDNENDYSYAGLLSQTGAAVNFRRTAKSRIGEDAPSFKGFQYFLRHVAAGNVPPKMTVHHEGRCGRCGRTLTVPESIESGFGPECIKRVAA